MAGRSQGQNRGRQQRQQGPTYTYGMADLLRQAARLPGVKQEADPTPEITQARRRVAAMIDEQTEWGRLAVARRAAEEMANPPQEGESVTAEAWKGITDGMGTLLAATREQVTAERTRADAAIQRQDQARSEGAASVRAQAQAEVSSAQGIAGLAIEAIKETTKAQVQAIQESSAAQVAAANGRSAFFENLASGLMGVQRQQVPQQPTDLKSQMQQLGEALTILHQFMPPPQTAAPQGLTLQDILALKADDRTDFWTREQAKMQRDATKELTSGIAQTLPHLGQGLNAWLASKGIQIPNIGAQSDDTLPPPPPPVGDA
jgi:hypothetical protein